MEEFRISTDKAELDIPLIHRFIAEESYWARGIPLHLVQRSIEHSLCFAGFVGEAQVAFARVVSDYATFAYLGDVFVLPEHRGKGYSKALVAAVLAHPGCKGYAASCWPRVTRMRCTPGLALRLRRAPNR